MAKVKMTNPVNWGNGTIASPREMLDRGLAEVRICDNFYVRGGGRRRAVFVDLIGIMTGVEVSGYVASKDKSHA